MILNRKQKIEKSFGDKASSYSRYAILQKESAQKLCGFLPENTPLNILEIGCGTGFLTEELQKKYPQAQILGIDISKQMVTACRQKFTGYVNLNFETDDGEYFESDKKFDLIVSNLAVQWFGKPVTGLKHLTKFLNDNGILFYTTIGKESFSEWRTILQDLEFPSGLIDSPDYSGIFLEDKKTVSYKNALDFLKSFKKIGAHQPKENYTPLSTKQLKKACDTYDAAYQGKITWHILYGALDSSGRAIKR